MNDTIWGDGVWAEGVWAEGVWGEAGSGTPVGRLLSVLTNVTDITSTRV